MERYVVTVVVTAAGDRTGGVSGILIQSLVPLSSRTHT